jgi:hypothetical protein
LEPSSAATHEKQSPVPVKGGGEFTGIVICVTGDRPDGPLSPIWDWPIKLELAGATENVCSPTSSLISTWRFNEALKYSRTIVWLGK